MQADLSGPKIWNLSLQSRGVEELSLVSHGHTCHLQHGKSWCQAAGVHTAGVPGLEDPPSVSPPRRAHPLFPASVLTGPQAARAHEATDHQ